MARWTIIIEDEEGMRGDPDFVNVDKEFSFDAETLNQVAQGIAESIRSAGYTYVESVTIHKGGGEDVNSDIIPDSPLYHNGQILDLFNGPHIDKKPNLKVVPDGEEKKE